MILRRLINVLIRHVGNLKNFFTFLDINDCDPNPCQYNGECVDGIANYTCNCVAGIDGPNCTISKYDMINSVHLKCLVSNPTLSSLTHISNYIFLDFNDCDPSPCINGGSCIDGVDSYTCVCHPGYQGNNCEIGKKSKYRKYPGLL